MTHQALKEALKEAMKNKDAVRLSVIRGLLSSVTNELVAKGLGPGGELPEEDLATVIRRAAKQRKDSIEQFEQGGRADLAEGEKAELAILDSLLPPLMGREEVDALVKAKAAELGITDKSKANQLIGALMKDLKGKADGVVVKESIEALLS